MKSADAAFPRHRAAAALVLVGVVGAVGGAACLPDGAAGPAPAPLVLVSEDPSDNPLQPLSAAQQRTFDAGDVGFDRRYFASQGLGPLYIRTSCVRCHDGDAKGPGFVEKMVLLDDDGTVTVPADGVTVRPFVEAGATTAIVPGDDARLFISTRIGPAVFGRGFMEAVSDDAIEAVEASQLERDDGISGRIHRVAWQSEANPDATFHAHRPGDTGLIGRFGLKGRIATLDDFTADAFQGDMGLTSPLRPTEPANPDGLPDDLHPGIDVDADAVNDIATYMRLLAIPTRRAPAGLSAADITAAAILFDDVRCAVCHVPTLATSTIYPIDQLQGIDAALFSDLLLHDLGDDLQDHVVDGDATGREWRTAPLMGLRFFGGYLHDGRAATVEDAIVAHASEGSEANDSVERFTALSQADRTLLLTYVESL